VTQRRDLRAALDAAKEIFKIDPDRTFTQAQDSEECAPGIPVEVLDAAVVEGNKTADAINAETKKAVN